MRVLPFLLALVLALPAVAARTVRLVPGPGAQGIVAVLEPTADADRARVVAELGRDYEGITEVRVAITREGFRTLLPPDRVVPEWAQGVAFPDLNLVVVRAAPGDADPRATMRHELSHIAVGRLAAHPVPRWYLEGLATIQAGDAWNRKGPSLVKAALTEGLFSFSYLDDAFPARASDAELAYAQSADFIQYLVDRSGMEALEDVLTRVVKGEYFDDAFTNALGVTRRAAENDWRRSLARWELLARLVTSGELWWGTLGFLALYAAFALRRRTKQRMKMLEEEEQEEAARALAEAAAEWAERGAVAHAEGATPEQAGSFDPADEDEEFAPDDEEGGEPDPASATKKPTLH